MLDIAFAYNKYKFLGNEFLTWLLFAIESNLDIKYIKDLFVGNKIKIDKKAKEETLMIRGDLLFLKEAKLAIEEGGRVTELALLYKDDQGDLKFSIKGESFNLSNISFLPNEGYEKSSDLEEGLLNQVYIYSKIFQIQDSIFNEFLKLRLSAQWEDETVKEIQKWTTNLKQ